MSGLLLQLNLGAIALLLLNLYRALRRLAAGAPRARNDALLVGVLAVLIGGLTASAVVLRDSGHATAAAWLLGTPMLVMLGVAMWAASKARWN